MKNKEIIYSATAIIIIALMFCFTYYFVKNNNNERYVFNNKYPLVLDKKTGEVFNFRNGKKIKMQEGENY